MKIKLTSASESAGGTDLKQAFNSTDVGLDLGIGVKFPIADKTKFFIELNGAAAFTDLIKNNTGDAIRNSASAINIGLSF